MTNICTNLIRAKYQKLNQVEHYRTTEKTYDLRIIYILFRTEKRTMYHVVLCHVVLCRIVPNQAQNISVRIHKTFYVRYILIVLSTCEFFLYLLTVHSTYGL